MRFSLVTTFCAAMLLAACSTPQEEGTGASGGGSTGGTTTSNTSDASAAPTPLPGPPPGTMEALTVEVGDRIFFDYDQYNIRADQRNTVEALAAWLDANGSATLTLEGHADERGTREYNLALGARRAAATRDYLIARGIPAGRIRTISYGKERPVAVCNDISCWSQNRRAVTLLAAPSG